MEKIVFLIILTLTNTGNSEFTHHYHEMPSMEVCQRCVDNAKIAIPKAGDAEAAVVMYCAEDKARVLSYKELNR